MEMIEKKDFQTSWKYQFESGTAAFWNPDYTIFTGF